MTISASAQDVTEEEKVFTLHLENSQLKELFDCRRTETAEIDSGDSFLITVNAAYWVDVHGPLNYKVTGKYAVPPPPPPPQQLASPAPNATQAEQIQWQEKVEYFQEQTHEWQSQQQASQSTPQAQQTFQGEGAEVTIIFQRIGGILQQVPRPKF